MFRQLVPLDSDSYNIVNINVEFWAGIDERGIMRHTLHSHRNVCEGIFSYHHWYCSMSSRVPVVQNA
jgi:hypothetical protein